jgi:anti-sigma regulatory factor (Ser/Thr protein kinase)
MESAGAEMGAGAEQTITFRVAAEPHACRHVRTAAEAFARDNGVEKDDIGAFLTAFGEALANAIEHSRAADPIEIVCSISSDCIVAVVTDHGVGFPAGAYVGSFPELEAERGRGMHIMRRCSDIFEVRSAPGSGAAVVVGRRFRTSAGGGSSADGRRVAAV